MKKKLFAATSFLILLAAVSPSQEGLKIYISADMDR
jgi:hypothetical protein